MSRFATLTNSLLPIGLLAVTILLQACRSKTPPPVASVTTDNKPIITTIRFPGIPQQDVAIDQTTRTLTIKVPERIQDDMTPTIQTTGAVRAVGCNATSLSLFSRSQECGIWLVEKKDPGQLVNPVVEYKIKLVPTGKQQVATITEPLRYKIFTGAGISLPMLHLYGNGLPTEAYLTSAATNKKLTLKAPGVQPGITFSQSPNQLLLNLYTLNELLPGTYQIELRTADGSSIQVPQPVLVEVGKASFSSPSLEWDKTPQLGPGSELEVEGTNLFEGLISLQMIDSTDAVTPIRITKFDPYGRKLTLQIPDTFRPYGHYIVRLVQTGVAQSTCYRFRLHPAKFPDLYIDWFGDYGGACSNKGPLQLPRNQVFGVTIPVSDDKLRFKLASVTNSQQAYYIPVKAYSYTSGQIPLPLVFPPR